MQTLARVSVKIGDIGKSSRTNVRVEDAEFTFEDDTDDFEMVCAKVEERVVASLELYETKTKRPDANIYLKPSLHAAQKDFIALTAENFSAKVTAAKSNYYKRTKDSGPFVVELFAFAVKEISAQAVGIRRATASRVQEAALAIDSFLVDRPDVDVGEIARTHWTMTHARQPNGTQPSLPATATFRQMQHLDAMKAASGHDHREEAVFRTITVRLNGSTDLQLAINVQELRQALGLPNYNLMVDGVFSSFVPPPEPADNMDDVDHMSD